MTRPDTMRSVTCTVDDELVQKVVSVILILSCLRCCPMPGDLRCTGMRAGIGSVMKPSIPWPG